MGGVDVVFNNAGYGMAGPLEGLTDEQIVRMVETNMMGAIRTTKAFLPYFREKGTGLFINTTSIGGLITVPFNSLYHATKWALEGWGESMAFELKQFGIGLKIVEPGGMKTDFFTRSFDTGRHEAYDKLVNKVMSVITDPKQMETYSSLRRSLRWCTKPPLTGRINSAMSPARMRKRRMRCDCRLGTKRFAKPWVNSFSGTEDMMKSLVRALSVTAAIFLIGMVATMTIQAQNRRLVQDRFATVGGVRLHYLEAGKGEPVILLHGYAQNSHMWRPLMIELAKTRLVIAPDLRGFGQSSKPARGYDKKTMAQDVHALAASLGFNSASVVGHDIGLMVAYAYAAQYPSEVDRIVLMDAFLPGVGDWKTVWLLRDLWHFHFYGVTPLKLVAGQGENLFRAFLE